MKKSLEKKQKINTVQQKSNVARHRRDINSMLRHQVINVVTSDGECHDIYFNVVTSPRHRLNVTTSAEVGRVENTNVTTSPRHQLRHHT